MLLMTIRIPPSINWLIKQHQRLNGELADVERELIRLQCVKSALERELDAVLVKILFRACTKCNFGKKNRRF